MFEFILHMHIYIKMIQPFFPQGVTKCQNTETMLSLMAMAGGISEHMLNSWFSFYYKLRFNTVPYYKVRNFLFMTFQQIA